MKHRHFTLFVLLLFCAFTYAQNNERIIHFQADIKIETDGKITVSEQIKVLGGKTDIKRGIVRSIPRYRKDEYGRKVQMDFTVLHVYRDGKKEPFHTETAGDNEDVFIGDANVLLEPGVYEYKIVYESYGHVGFFDGYDELYWNVTGNEWVFDIEKASATITLPDSTSVINNWCYTGKAGSTATECTSKISTNRNSITFESNRSFRAGEGLTVAVSFTPGIIKRPPPPTFWERLWFKYGTYGFPALLLICMFLYHYFTWKKVGRDPEKPVIVPTFNPPYNLSPAVVRYLYKQGYDNKVFTAALVHMAVNKAIQILVEKRKFYLVGTTDNSQISMEEKEIYKKIFSTMGEPISDKSIKVSNDNHFKFSSAVDSLNTSLNKQWDLKNLKRNNKPYIVISMVLSALCFMLYTFLLTNYAVFYLIMLIVLIMINYYMIIMALRTKKGFTKVFITVLSVFAIFSTTRLSFEISSLFFEGEKVIVVPVFFVLLAVSVLIYSFLIKAPTKEYVQIKANLEGFKMYLKTAEENRLEHITPPERTPELFERYLPYAIALDVENAWSKKFDDVLKEANYTPEWYLDNKPFTSAIVTSALSRSFNSSISSAQVSPRTFSSSSGSSGSSSWGSGSSGGGSSGGGGGGGGGRGW